MANASAVTVSSLTESAIIYQKDLRHLPYAVLREELGRLGINLYPNVQHKDVITEFLRKQGIMAPYASSISISNSLLGKTRERVLELKSAYASVKDNVKNYKNTFIGANELLVNQTKKNPMEFDILMGIVRTFTEDLMDTIFGGVYNGSGTTPLDCFDGLYALIDAEIIAGTIAAAEGNYHAMGSLAAPTSDSDYTAFNSVLAMWRAGDPMLRQKPSRMYMPWDVFSHVQDAIFNKYKQKPTADDYNRFDLPGSGGRCLMVPCNFMGTGEQVILTVPENIDFGMNSLGDADFVQVRNPYEDPNEVQYYIQGDYGMRIRSSHKKVFMVSDGASTPAQLSGDYS